MILEDPHKLIEQPCITVMNNWAGAKPSNNKNKNTDSDNDSDMILVISG